MNGVNNLSVFQNCSLWLVAIKLHYCLYNLFYLLTNQFRLCTVHLTFVQLYSLIGIQFYQFCIDLGVGSFKSTYFDLDHWGRVGSVLTGATVTLSWRRQFQPKSTWEFKMALFQFGNCIFPSVILYYHHQRELV